MDNIIRGHNLKDRLYNCQKKKDKNNNNDIQNTTQKNTD